MGAGLFLCEAVGVPHFLCQQLKMRFRTLLPFLLSALAMGVSSAQAQTDPVQLRAHVEVLASDAYKGRAAGGPAERMTTRYIQRAFADAGLEPALPGGKWFQPVPLIRRSSQSWAVSIRAGKAAQATLPPEATVLIGGGMRNFVHAAPVVFIGYGIVDPLTGRNDLKDMDLKGAVVLRLIGQPPEYAAAGRQAPSYAERREIYRQSGAVAEISIAEDDERFGLLQAAYRKGLVQLDDKTPALSLTGQMRGRDAAMWLQQAGQSLEAMKTAAKEAHFRPLPVDWRISAMALTRQTRFRSSNVIGRLKGTASADGAIVVTAHWDGYGLCQPRKAADRICNGAIDNASGIAGLIEAARNLASGARPARDFIFIATTAEEHGLLGAEHYARNPVVPLSETVAALNLDTIALRGRGAPVGIIGKGLTSLDAIVTSAALAQGRSILDDASVQQYYSRSDHFALARRGVPAVMMTGLFSREREKGDAVDRYFAEQYHQPGDELAMIPSFDGAAEDVDLMLAVARAIAEKRDPPAWAAGSPYRRQ